MAQQMDVNAILAALAAQQQNNGTPSQSTPVQPPQPPPGFPSNLPQSSGTPSMGGFALPQPTTSGSVDLSAVRPVNTGSVSISEAIAKAKSIAADRGIPSGSPRDDPRLSGRGFRRSRSRSRSPGRRDNFRDNYNPYRDERRDDRRGYGRDRSHSPRRGGGPGGSFSPRGGGGGGDKDSETITVKSALVGLIIGRAGENLRRVESESGARVQFIPAVPGSNTRQCTITGNFRQRDTAKRDIFHTIEENGGGPITSGISQSPYPGQSQQQKQASQPALREGENSRQILVPDKTVGLIIGRGGETIRDLQDRSGCHVNIVGENKSINGRRPVNLIGSKEASDRAEALIWEIVESDTRIAQEQQQQQQQQRNRGFDSYGGGQNDETEEIIHVPSESVGMIIGKGGETIKQMQSQTGCKINVNQPQSPDIERRIDLVGSRSAIEAAKRVIYDKVDTVQQRDSGKRSGGRDNYGDNSYGQQSQPSYGQQSSAPAGMPSMPGGGAAPPTDPNAPDPYAAYGGYQNYVALWYASMMAQQQQGGQQPPQS